MTKPRRSKNPIANLIKLFSDSDRDWTKIGVAIGSIVVVAFAAWAKADSGTAVSTARSAKSTAVDAQDTADHAAKAVNGVGRKLTVLQRTLEQVGSASDEINDGFARAIDERFRDGFAKLKRQLKRFIRRLDARRG